MTLLKYMHIDSLPDVTIGFEQTYSVGEDGGSIEVCAAIRAGTLQTSVVVTMATVDGTAIGMYVYMLVSFISALN